VRRRVAAFFFLFLACSAPLLALPDGSLQRAEDVSQSIFTWELAGSYFPMGEVGAGIDEQGGYYTYTQYSGESKLSFSTSWGVGRILTLGLSLTESTLVLRESRITRNGDSECSSRVSDLRASGHCELRIMPSNPLDPRIRVTHSGRESTEIALQLSEIRDPTVLACMLGIERTPDNSDSSANITLSAGFVANSRVSLSVVGQWSVPVESARLPTSLLCLHARCSRDDDLTDTLHFRLFLTTTGKTTWIGFGGSIRVSVSGQ